MQLIKVVEIFQLIFVFMINLKIKTKNDYFLDMLNQILSWGANIAWITADSWYSSTANLKSIKKKHGIKLMMGIDIIARYPLKRDNGFKFVYCQNLNKVKWFGLKISALYNYLRPLKEQQRFYTLLKTRSPAAASASPTCAS